MKRQQIIILLLIVQIAACKAQNTRKDMQKTYKYTNHLIHESSPYLLQHAHNPVNWYPWGNEALEKARKEQKMLLISIGYAACHWCHVMEEESFENDEIAKLMNENYVCIKVDREERPDIDQIYMNAAQLITGGGGWPLNCFALPDGTPFYAGTYFPPKRWTDVLKSLAYSWKNEKNKILKAAEQLKNGIANTEVVTTKSEVKKFTLPPLKAGIENWKKNFDKKFGSNKQSPKFPMPADFEFLLSYHFHTHDTEIQEHIQTTLQKMAFGGIFDHLGGGFARYSVDAQWRVPHFEKMLYDNAQLISLYSNAYKLFGNELYKDVVYKTFEFLKTELSNGNGVYYSSLDADSEGEEGKYYVWNYEELKKLVPANQWQIFENTFEIKPNGNWEGKIILYQKHTFSQVAKELKLQPAQVKNSIEKSLAILNKMRKKRIMPQLDDKSITAWNALTISGFCRAYEAFGDPKFLNEALKIANFFQQNIISDDYSLARNFKDGKASITGFLDDYALTLKAFIDLFGNTGEKKYLEIAHKLLEYSLQHFHNEQSAMFFYTSDESFVPVARKMEITDGVIPSSNSIMAQNLFNLSKIYYNDDWAKTAEQMLANVTGNIHRYPSFFANWADLELKFIYPCYEVAILGPNASKLQQQLSKNFIPNIVCAFSQSPSEIPLLSGRFVENNNLIYVCENKVCKMPVSRLEEALKIFHKQ